MNIKSRILSLALLTLLISPLTHAANLLDTVSNSFKTAANQLTENTEDDAITIKVKSLLALESDIKSFDIHVTTTDKIVHLSGTVDTRLQANRAIELAQSVKGVTEVDDSDLKVKKSDNYLADATLTAKAKIKIMQLASEGKIDHGSDLHVETTNKVVHIFGHVANKDDVKTIVDAVKEISDVTGVNTNIDVTK